MYHLRQVYLFIFFFACLWTETELGFPAILTEQAWSILKKTLFSCGTQRVNRKGKIVPSCPLGQPISTGFGLSRGVSHVINSTTVLVA